MYTFDCLHFRGANELTVIATGTASAPVVIDRDSGNSVTMHPASANTELARHLVILADGIVRHATMRWPEPEPEPELPPRLRSVGHHDGRETPTLALSRPIVHRGAGNGWQKFIAETTRAPLFCYLA